MLRYYNIEKLLIASTLIRKKAIYLSVIISAIQIPTNNVDHASVSICIIYYACVRLAIELLSSYKSAPSNIPDIQTSTHDIVRTHTHTHTHAYPHPHPHPHPPTPTPTIIDWTKFVGNSALLQPGSHVCLQT